MEFNSGFKGLNTANLFTPVECPTAASPLIQYPGLGKTSLQGSSYIRHQTARIQSRVFRRRSTPPWLHTGYKPWDAMGCKKREKL